MELSDNLPDIYETFIRHDIRIGVILSAMVSKMARKPAYKLEIDFGPFGKLHSSAQITALYTPESLVGKKILAVINLPPLQVAGTRSECLVLGAINPAGEVVLLTPDPEAVAGDPVR
ncbi:MAG TPA: tRNA-binding protein [Bacteroidia bacterium]|nr:tRNA-binding protein [Bacteroidia bacterium]